jgi:stalled ribosome rescue protein Dom34
MKNNEQLYDDAVKEVLDSGNQNLKNMALLGIGNAKKEMFDFLQDKAEEKEYTQLSVIEFFNKLERELLF